MSASLLNTLRAGPPPPPVVLLPCSPFFVRAFPVEAGVTAADVAAQAELALESVAPFPLAQLYFGHHWVPGSTRVLVFGAYRRRFTAEDVDGWAGADLVVPAFASVLGLGVEPGTTVVLREAAGLTAVRWEDGPVPSGVLTRPVAAEATDAERAHARDALLKEIGESVRVIDVPELPVAEPSRSDREIVIRVGERLSRLPAAVSSGLDVRDKAVLSALRLSRARDVTLWRLAFGSVAACGLLLLGEIGLKAGGIWHASQVHRVDSQKTVVDHIMRDQELANRIEDLSTKRLLPLEMISIAARRKPASIQFVRAQTTGLYALRVEAQTNAAGEIGPFRAALESLPVCDKVEIHDQRSRDALVTFTLEITFKPALLKPAAPSA